MSVTVVPYCFAAAGEAALGRKKKVNQVFRMLGFFCFFQSHIALVRRQPLQLQMASALVANQVADMFKRQMVKLLVD